MGLQYLAHERYDQLLKKLNVINEAFVDYRTHAVLRKNAQGQLVATVETAEGTGTDVVPIETGGDLPDQPSVAPTDTRVEQGKLETGTLKLEIVPRGAFLSLQIPLVRTSTIESPFSLSDIVDRDPFKKLGERLRADPEDTLRRKVVSAVVVVGKDGIPETRLKTATAADQVKSSGTPLPIEKARAELVRGVLAAEIAPARESEKAAVRDLVEAFLGGLGNKAEELLGAYLDRGLAHLIELIQREQKKYTTKPKYEDIIEFKAYRPTRIARTEVSNDLAGIFKRNIGYEGWKKSMFAQEWFDSRPERDVANMLEDSDEVEWWIRLPGLQPGLHRDRDGRGPLGRRS